VYVIALVYAPIFYRELPSHRMQAGVNVNEQECVVLSLDAELARAN